MELLLPLITDLFSNVKIIAIGGGDNVKSLISKLKQKNPNFIWSGALPPEWSLYMMKNAKEYLFSCGLSNLTEMFLYRGDGLGLLAQNYSQHLQIRKFKNMSRNWQAIDYSDLNKKLRLNEFLPEEEGVKEIQKFMKIFIDQPEYQEIFVKKVKCYFLLSSQDKKIELVDSLDISKSNGAEEVASILHRDLYPDEYLHKWLSSTRGDGLFESIHKLSLKDFIDYKLSNVYPILPNIIELKLKNNYNNIWILDRDNRLSSIDVITGGPCICYTKGDLSKITLQDIIDILMPMVLAKIHHSKLVLVFSSYESLLEDDFSNFEYQQKYLNMFEKMNDLIIFYAEKMNFSKEDIFFINTTDFGISENLDAVGNLFLEKNQLSTLMNLYTFNSSDDVQQGKERLRIYLRNISMYTTPFIEYVIGKPITSLAVVENSRQILAIQKGFELSRAYGYQGINAHFAYIATPGLTGLEMANSGKSKQILLGDTEEEIREKFSKKMPLNVGEYFLNLFPKAIRDHFDLSGNSIDQVVKLFQITKEVLNND